jgi:AraC family transcriptional regulator of adaptative response/methylated-DNA-[protein]-cysteine methyltransferase
VSCVPNINIPIDKLPDEYIKSLELDTPIGRMIAIADDCALLLLEFTERPKFQTKLNRIQKFTKATVEPGTNAVLESVVAEVKSYFAGTLREFQIPLKLFGTEFQKSMWQQLQQIPYGNTRSYCEQANAVGKSTAHRAVGNANGANQISIIIPCHRVINSSGALGGYGGGLDRKKWLLDHEKAYGAPV